MVTLHIRQCWATLICSWKKFNKFFPKEPSHHTIWQQCGVTHSITTPLQGDVEGAVISKRYAQKLNINQLVKWATALWIQWKKDTHLQSTPSNWEHFILNSFLLFPHFLFLIKTKEVIATAKHRNSFSGCSNFFHCYLQFTQKASKGTVGTN